MSNRKSLNNRAVVERAVKEGIKAYADSRRRNITPFIEDHFSFKGAWELNKWAQWGQGPMGSGLTYRHLLV